MTAGEAIAAAASRLRAAGVDNPARDARVLLAHAARIEAGRVTLIAPEDLAPDVAEHYDRLVSLRAIRVPVSHLVGERSFYGRVFKVSADVLDPRPDTETLIEVALSQPFERLLDLGTGSGCILVTLLAERKSATGVGIDISETACLQASANAVLNHVQDRADIRQGDWFSGVTDMFDLIVANPPYIALSEWETLQDEVKRHEPRIALTDEGDGLAAYRQITAQAARFMAPEARLVLEIGPTQAPAVCDLLHRAQFRNVTTIQDIDGRDRVISATTPQI